jgi:transmembrane sensor
MQKRLTSRDVDELAAHWATRVDAESLSEIEQEKLKIWLQADLRHFGAFAKASAVIAASRRVKALGQTFELEKYVAPVRPSRRAAITGSAAAACAISLGAGEEAIRKFLSEKDFTTRVGETQIVPLDDGSMVTLNTNSSVAVRYTQDRRDVRLIHGEALFDVAKSNARPFVVEANGTQVRAVGTSFTVSSLPNRPVEVLVREGIVEVKRPAVPAVRQVRLLANDRALAPADSPIKIAAVDPAEITRALSWRVGRLAFEAETLKNAAAMFERYSDTRIEIDDPDVANETVTGLFVSNDPIGFSRAVAQALNLRAEVENNVVRITR